MNTQFVIDLSTLALALSFYFTIKCIYYLLFYFLCNPSGHWDSGYTAGHNALADKIRPDIEKLARTWTNFKNHVEAMDESKKENSTKTDDRKVPREEQNI
ncbi:hypothetical protein HQN86_12590 [Pedobacter panaciterrae]|uniref:hypothetical protein n=1 Tax=Pedobacter panaciterrae TaxID=363849 RepID=UPI00155DCE3C|nr:hypothetical protein [Pedobacter panaciterrae]NQX54455.1 hypothetical protein [Pedobacter panaciterrae]